jgi:hypothetical protein
MPYGNYPQQQQQQQQFGAPQMQPYPAAPGYPSGAPGYPSGAPGYPYGAPSDFGGQPPMMQGVPQQMPYPQGAMMGPQGGVVPPENAFAQPQGYMPPVPGQTPGFPPETFAAPTQGGLMPAQGNLFAPPPPSLPSQAMPAPAGDAAKPQFDGAGIIQRSATAAPGQPQHVLLTPNGRVLAYLQGEPGVNLDTYVGQSMGLFGQRSHHPDLSADMLTVRGASPVRLKQPAGQP